MSDSTNARMSRFVTRPPLPVPSTAFGSTPCSEAIRATTGETNALPFPEAVSREGSGAACASSTCSAVGVADSAEDACADSAAACAVAGSCGDSSGAASGSGSPPPPI